MTIFPTGGVKKPEWVSNVKNRCRDILIVKAAEIDFFIVETPEQEDIWHRYRE